MYFDFETNIEYADSKLKGELENEQLCNENARHKIIGISLETRPDHINKYEIMRLRNYGCTRVQPFNA